MTDTTGMTTPEVDAVINRARGYIGSSQTPGFCLRFIRTLWGASGGIPDPNTEIPSLQKAGHITNDMNPPIGAPVWFQGGTHGHVAIVSKYVNGVPYIITTDYPKKGSVGEVPLSELQSAWGNLKYQGWSSVINNKTLNLGAAGGGNGNVTNPSSNDVFAQIASEYGLTDALLNLDKTDKNKGFTLREAFDAIRTGKDYIVNGKVVKGVGAPITDATIAGNILAQTDWFKSHGVSATQRLAQEQTSPGVFKQNIDDALATLRDRAKNIGINATDDQLRSIAKQVYVYGINDSQQVDLLLKSGAQATTGSATGPGASSTGQMLNNLDDLAYKNGVTINAKDRQLWANDLAGGGNVDKYEQILRNKSAAMYSVFGDQIRQGQNLSDLTSAYRDKMANLLEVSTSDIKWDDPLFKDGKAFTTTDAAGKPAQKSLWDFEKDIRNDQRWQYTQNAHDYYSSAATGLLRRFGMSV